MWEGKGLSRSCYVSCVECEPVDGDGYAGSPMRGGMGVVVAWFSSWHHPCSVTNRPTCFFLLLCAWCCCFSNFPLSRALRAVPLNQSRQIVVI